MGIPVGNWYLDFLLGLLLKSLGVSAKLSTLDGCEGLRTILVQGKERGGVCGEGPTYRDRDTVIGGDAPWHFGKCSVLSVLNVFHLLLNFIVKKEKA